MPGLGTGALPSNFILQGRYTILDKLSQGGMGAVYKVADQRIGGKIWAAKEMSDAALSTPQERAQAVAAFQQEAQLLATLDHPNIPKVTDYFTENHKHYIVMEFVPGETLEERLVRQQVPCSEQEVREWALQLCVVLSYLHKQTPPVIFRDLKPANIMLTPQGQLKLIDFGIARFFQPGKGKDTQILGTPGYAPPEQYGQGQTDARSDIYSLGVTLHTLLTGHDPETTPFSLPPVRQLNQGVSRELEEVIAKATQTDVSQRYQDVSEMSQAQGRDATPPPRPRGQQVGQPRPGILVSAAFIGLVMCVVLALGLGIAIASRSINAPQPTPTRAIIVMPPATRTPTPTPTALGRGEAPPTETPTSTLTKSPTPARTRTPTPKRPTKTPTPNWSAYESAISAVVFEYGQIKVEATTNLNPSRLDEVLIDPVLERQRRSVCWLHNEGLYYVYSNRSFAVKNITFEDDRHATLMAEISETRLLYRQSGDVYRDYGNETYRAIYQLERIGSDNWYIYCFQALEDGDPLDCKVDLTDSNPCSE